MDFDRAIIRCLFYDISPDIVLEMIKDQKAGSGFRPKLISLLSSALPSFTSREMEKLVCFELKAINKLNIWSYPFRKICEISQNLLDMDADYHPIVKIDQALRWNETTRYVGEDLFACSRVAKEADNHLRFTYHWDSPLLIINTGNKIKAADIHFHISSSYDACDLAWIVSMNNYDSSMLKCIFQAAIIRYALFRFLVRNKKIDAQLLKVVFNTSLEFDNYVKDVYAQINTITSPYINFPGEKTWDYAISGSTLDNNMIQSPYVLLWGERRLHELFFRKMYQDPNNMDLNNILPYYYLYHVIKTHFRKNIILNNGLVGLKNFQSLSRCKNLSSIQKICEFYGLQTASLLEMPIEARFGYNMDKEEDLYKFRDFVKERVCYHPLSPLLKYNDTTAYIGRDPHLNISYVLSVSKPECKSANSLMKDIKLINEQLYQYILNFRHCNIGIPCTGVDFAGSDTLCRPFVLATIVKNLRGMNCNNLTYHAGEDFFDLIDGIRTIDEILQFLDWNEGNRLGHCLSLFTDVDNYYKNRHYNMVLPKGILLDNLVWLLYKGKMSKVQIKGSVQSYVENKIQELFSFVYKGSLSTASYDELFGDVANLNNVRYRTDILCRYNDIDTWQLPKDDSIMQILKGEQERLLNEICRRNIHIETCPTSNLLIGYFNRYDEIPTSKLLKLSNIASINTDIKGSIGTSLLNEYALVRLALIKKGESVADVDSFLMRLGKQSLGAKFKQMSDNIN